MYNKVIGFGIAVLVLLLLAFTCPDKQEHQEKIKMTISNAIDEKFVESASESEQGFAFIGSLLVTKIVDIFLSNKLQVNNYFFFSTGQISYGGNTKTISFGILNQVFTFDEDDVRQAISETVDADNTEEDY
ncbi:DUF4359 domain-containing protein [Barnesiella viscericola]|uniref:DUF4359 domain-containing protein n=1 Tax=Barnesiella viscericola TaxID=397865 RepID=UPI0025A44361|nr:DUF4359 domain-containing protein [Barnesiella viscericola]MDM8268492.1 DUF4359 domain-containing protein [Barnesiella viscericola]